MRTSIILFAILYVLSPVLIEVSKEMHDVGSAKLMAYTWADWTVLGVSCAALATTNAISFFSTKWADYKVKREGTQPPFRP